MELAELGVDKAKLLEMVVNGLIDRIENNIGSDDEGNPVKYRSQVAERFEERAKELVKEKVDAFAATIVEPAVDKMLAELTFTEFSRYGERKGEPIPLREYIEKRIGNYLTEDVNYEGKSKEQSGNYSFTAESKRVAWLINRHLKYEINAKVTTALKDLNEQVANGIADTVKIQLAQVLDKLKIETKVR